MLIKRFLADDVATPDDVDSIQTAKKEFAQGETISHEDINWD